MNFQNRRYRAKNKGSETRPTSKCPFFLEKQRIWLHKGGMKIPIWSIGAVMWLIAASTGAQPPSDNESLALVHAVMCEAIEDGKPVNETVVFSFEKEKAVCFTYFNPVPKKTHIYHRWYRRDRLNATAKLQVNPPQWSTFSRIQLREGDKGPWRVEVVDADGNRLKILRFSITE